MSRRNPTDSERRRVHAMWEAFAPSWPDESQRATAISGLTTAALDAGEWEIAAGFLRAFGVPVSDVWEMIEVAAFVRDEDVGEVFRDLFEPEDLEGMSG